MVPGNGIAPKGQFGGFKDGEVPGGRAWQQTIFCQFGNSKLASSVGWLAKDLSCSIYWGEPFSPDIIAIPNFIMIVDRRTLGRERWAGYLGFREELQDSAPCILVDDLGACEDWRIDERMEIYSSEVNASVILDSVRAAYSMAQDWRPEDLT